jgi:hypothetical protein
VNRVDCLVTGERTGKWLWQWLVCSLYDVHEIINTCSAYCVCLHDSTLEPLDGFG